MKTIIYQGMKGAFSHITAQECFGSSCLYQPAETFEHVFEKLDKGDGDVALLPLENSLIGSIYENYDHLNRYNMHIIGEKYTRIEHCLLALPDKIKTTEERRKEIKRVLSHPKALEQCCLFLKKHPWMEPTAHSNTAAAAAAIAQSGDHSLAAIGSAKAAELYGLEIVNNNIEDDSTNFTRFILIARKEIENCSADKCSLIMHLKHAPGALADVLHLFAEKNINLSKIESRPLVGHPFEYVFYVDLEFNTNESNIVRNTLSILDTKVRLLKILGFYKKGSL